MIKITESSTADGRYCDRSNVSKEKLLASSEQHILDVVKAMMFFSSLAAQAGTQHDHDKITGIDQFYTDFRNGFVDHPWFDNHVKVNRHHISNGEGIPDDVNLIDVLEYIADCVMAGLGRAGEVYPIVISDALLQKAFNNTVELLKSNVEVTK